MAASTWRRLAKATVARRLVTLLVLVVLPVGSQSVLDAALAPRGIDEPGWQVAARVGVGGLAVAGTVGLVLLTLARDLRRRRLIADHDGRIHPSTLEVVPAGTAVAADARTYWWTWLVTAEPPAVFAARTGRPAVLGAPGVTTRTSRAEPRRTAGAAPRPNRPARHGQTDGPARPAPAASAASAPPAACTPSAAPLATGPAAALLAHRHELLLPGVLLLLVPAVVAALAGRSPITAAMIPAIAFVAFVVVRCVPWCTVPAELPLRRCDRCDHPLTPDNHRCPECGTEPRPGRLRAARPRPARRVAEAIVVGIAGCWLVGVLAAEPLTRAIRTSSAMPSTSLLADLSGAPDWDSAAFDALVERGPEPAVADRLAEIITQRRRANARVGAEAWAWFDTAVALGTISAAHEQARWRDSVELLRLVPIELAADESDSWGGVPVSGPSTDSALRAPDGPPGARHASDPPDDPASGIVLHPATQAAPAASASRRLAVRFIRRFDAADARRVGLVVVGVRVGDGPVVTPYRADGRLCLVAAGERPTRATWLPEHERRERPWPAPSEYVVPLPTLPPELVAAAEAGEPVILDVIRYVTTSSSSPIGVVRMPWGHRITGAVEWQHPEQVRLFADAGGAGGTPGAGGEDRDDRPNDLRQAAVTP